MSMVARESPSGLAFRGHPGSVSGAMFVKGDAEAPVLSEWYQNVAPETALLTGIRSAMGLRLCEVRQLRKVGQRNQLS